MRSGYWAKLAITAYIRLAVSSVRYSHRVSLSFMVCANGHTKSMLGAANDDTLSSRVQVCHARGVSLLDLKTGLLSTPGVSLALFCQLPPVTEP